MARQYLVAAINREIKQKEPAKGVSCAEDLIRVKILPDEDRSFQIEAGMKDKDRVKMLLLLVPNVDVFAWSPCEVPRVDPRFIVHKLNVDLLFPPKK